MNRIAPVFILALLLGGAVAQSEPPAGSRSQTDSSPAAQSPVEHIFGRKDGVTAPRVTYSPDPMYPKKARRPANQDIVALWVIVGSDGLTRDIRVARSLSPEFDQSAVEAVKKWKFVPATKDGKPVAVQISIEVSFRR